MRRRGGQMKKQLSLSLISLFCFVVSVRAACNGVEKWPIKTLQDSNASSIHLTPSTVSIDYLRGVNQSYHEADPRHGVELQVYRVTCKIEGYKTEGDGDFHIVIADQHSGHTMIAEIPNPDCPNVATSPSIAKFRTANQQFREFTTRNRNPTGNLFLVKPGYYTITGVGFIDKVHRQIGHADNGVEIHPVFSIVKAP
jgi:hypothetical protein